MKLAADVFDCVEREARIRMKLVTSWLYLGRVSVEHNLELSQLHLVSGRLWVSTRCSIAFVIPWIFGTMHNH